MNFRFTTNQAQQRLLNGETRNQLIFVEIEYDGGVVRLHTSRGDKPLHGHTWKGIGEVLKISEPGEEEGTGPSRMSLSLLFQDNSLFADIMNNDPTGNQVTIYLAQYDDNWQLIEAPVYFQGDMDAPVLKDLKSHFSVTSNITDFFEIWSRGIEHARMSDAAHQAIHPGDKIFDQVEILAKLGIDDYVPGQQVGNGGGRDERWTGPSRGERR